MKIFNNNLLILESVSSSMCYAWLFFLVWYPVPQFGLRLDLAFPALEELLLAEVYYNCNDKNEALKYLVFLVTGSRIKMKERLLVCLLLAVSAVCAVLVVLLFKQSNPSLQRGRRNGTVSKWNEFYFLTHIIAVFIIFLFYIARIKKNIYLFIL